MRDHSTGSYRGVTIHVTPSISFGTSSRFSSSFLGSSEMTIYSWPDPLPRPDYPVKTAPIPKEIVHAVGVIVMAWTHCEETHLEIIKGLCGFGMSGENEYRIGCRIFEPMGNRQRNELLAGLLEEINIRSELKELIQTFRRHFDICLVNRNLVTHAIFVEEMNSAAIISRKSIPNIQDRYIPEDISFWEETINEIHRLYDFGMNIIDCAFASEPPPLPARPPEPRNLTRLIPPHIARPHQPL